MLVATTVVAVELSNKFGAKGQSKEGANNKVLGGRRGAPVVLPIPTHCGGCGGGWC